MFIDQFLPVMMRSLVTETASKYNEVVPLHFPGLRLLAIENEALRSKPDFPLPSSSPNAGERGLKCRSPNGTLFCIARH